MALATLPTAPALAGTPPAPVCGRTVTFVKAVDGVEMLADGGVFPVETLTFIEYSPVSDACVPEPVAATIELMLECPGGGGGSIEVVMTPGYNAVTVPVVVPAGPPRLCSVIGTVTVTFSDGLVLTQTADTVVCLVEPTPADVPRLDLRMIDLSDVIHPGDQAHTEVQITNNDVALDWTGGIEGTMEHRGGLPGVDEPGPPGTGAHAPGDPGPGDDFPIEWLDMLPKGGCIPRPDASHESTESTVSRDLTLAPGETRIFTIVSRAFNSSRTGACGELTVVADGSFGGADGDPAIACGGAAIAIDTIVPPSYAWDDSGKTGRIFPPRPGDPFVRVRAEPTPDPGDDWGGTIVIEPGPVIFDGLPLVVEHGLIGMRLNAFDARLEHHVFDPIGDPLWEPDSFFEVEWTVRLEGDSGTTAALDEASRLLGAPTGFEDIAPILRTTHVIEDTIVSRFEGTQQFVMDGIDRVGQSIPIQIVQLQLVSEVNDLRIRVNARGLGDPNGPPIQRLRIRNDFRGHALRGDNACQGDLDGDGQIDFADLLLVLAGWGTPSGDVNGDGTTDFQDLLLILALWGPCP